MVDAITAPQQFTTIKYTAKDGENISATKKDGVVTLVGDKNGVRQVPLDDFKKELAENLAQPQLEKSPEKDTVEISKEEKVPAKDEPKTEEKAPVETPTKEEPKAELGKKLDVAA